MSAVIIENVLYCTFSFFGCITNGVVFAIIIKHRRTLPVRAMLVASLLANGVLSAGIGFTSSLVQISHGTDRKIRIAFLVSYFIIYFSATLHLFFAACERYIFIVFPLRHTRMFTGTRVWMIVAFCYVFSFVFCMVLFISSNGISITNIPEQYIRSDYCTYFDVTASFVSFPDMIVIILYLHIFMIAKRQRRKVAAAGYLKHSVSIRPIITLLITATYSAIFSLCYVAIIIMTCVDLTLPSLVEPFLRNCPVVIILLHPVVHGIGDTTIRKRIAKCFSHSSGCA